MSAHPEVGSLRLAAAADAWLNIQLAIEDLLQASATEPKPEGAKRKQDAEPEAAKRGHNNAKQAVMKAMTALGGTGTRKQVMAYLQRHPEIYAGADASTMERSIRGISLVAYCERHGKNERGEDTFCLAASPCPTGVRRMQHGFVGRMQIKGIKCSGPLRRCANAAKKDFQKLLKWRGSMTPAEVIQCVRGWDGARVTKSTRVASRENGHRPCGGELFPEA